MAATKTTSIPPCVVFINGFPGIGKLTVARTLQAQITSNPTTLIHNHLLIDPVEAIAPGRTPFHYKLRREFRELAFSALKDEADEATVLIMTSCTASNDADAEVFAEHVDIAQVRKIPFVCINLLCDVSKQLARLQSQERRSGLTCKLTDPTVLERMMRDHGLLNPKDFPGVAEKSDIRFLELDMTHRSASEAANEMMRFIKNMRPAGDAPDEAIDMG